MCYIFYIPLWKHWALLESIYRTGRETAVSDTRSISIYLFVAAVYLHSGKFGMSVLLSVQTIVL